MPQQATNKDENGNWTDTWSKLPGYVRVLIAIGTIWVAGASSTYVVEHWFTTPAEVHALEARLEGHINNANNRLAEIEADLNTADDKARQRFIYLGCMLEAIREDHVGRRCQLVLDSQDRLLIQQITNQEGNGP